MGSYGTNGTNQRNRRVPQAPDHQWNKGPYRPCSSSTGGHPWWADSRVVPVVHNFQSG